MRTAVFTGPGEVKIAMMSIPEPGPGEVIIRVEGCGVCASNLAHWQGMPWSDYPLAPGEMGHEAWGTVYSLGPGVNKFHIGDRVVGLTYRSYADFDRAPADRLMRLPSELNNPCIPGEPLGCAFNIFRRSHIRAGQTVAIIGIGFLGAILAKLASDAGARVIAISRRPFSLEVAKGQGASFCIRLEEDFRPIIERVKTITNGRFCERVIEATGKQWPLDLAGEISAEAGRLVIAGYHQDGTREVNMQLWNWRGLDVVNAHERNPAQAMSGIRAALEVVKAGKLNLDPLFTHFYSLEELGKALNDTRDRPEGFLKAVVLNS